MTKGKSADIDVQHLFSDFAFSATLFYNTNKKLHK